MLTAYVKTVFAQSDYLQLRSFPNLESYHVAAYQSWQSHSSHNADQFNGGTIMDEAITNRKLFRLALIIVNYTKNKTAQTFQALLTP